jgi:hypothetical protein
MMANKGHFIFANIAGTNVFMTIFRFLCPSPYSLHHANTILKPVIKNFNL